MTPDEYRAHIKRLVDAAPPLTAERKARLAILLAPTRSTLGRAA